MGPSSARGANRECRAQDPLDGLTLCPLATRNSSLRSGVSGSSTQTQSEIISLLIGRVNRAYRSPVMIAM